MNDTDYMRLALEQARRGEGWTNPNPMVGAVLVRDGRILSTGYHERCGAPMPSATPCPAARNHPPVQHCTLPWSPAATTAASPPAPTPFCKRASPG